MPYMILVQFFSPTCLFFSFFRLPFITKSSRPVLEKFNNYLTTETSLEKAAIADIGRHFSWRAAKHNEILVDYEEVCRHYYFINSGAMRVFTLNSEGLETSRFFAFENKLCTALPSFIDQKQACEYLQCIEKSELLVCSRTDFYRLIHRYPELDRLYREILELRFIASQKRIYGFQGFNALEKVQWVIKNQPYLLLRVSNKMVASYLGISPSTLSRIKAKL